MSVAFSQAVLQSEQTMNSYLQAKETIDALKTEASRPYVKGQGKLGTRDIIWAGMTSPLISGMGMAVYFGSLSYLAIPTCFIYFTRYVIANAFYSIGAASLGLRLMVQTEYILGNENRLIGSFIYSSNILVPTLNKLSPKEAEEIYTHPAIPLSNVPETIKHRFRNYICNKHCNKQIDFSDIGGQCAGLSNLFSYLFFQTKRFYQDEEHQLVAITSKINNGAGKEAALWQMAQTELVVNGNSGYLLGPLLGLKRVARLSIDEPNIKNLTEFFKLVKPGLYRLSTIDGETSHRMCFYKGSQSNYVFDPNKGLIKLSSDEALKEWIEQVLEVHFSSTKKKEQSLIIILLS
jgi:hypothetical protein